MLALSVEDRAELAAQLLDSLDGSDSVEEPEGLARVWSDEAATRAGQIDAGEVELDSWDDLMVKVARSRSAE